MVRCFLKKIINLVSLFLMILFRNSILFWISFDYIFLTRNFSISSFHLNCLILHEVVHYFIYNHVNFQGVANTFYILDPHNLHTSAVLCVCVCWASVVGFVWSGLLALLIFKNKFWFYWFDSIVTPFSYSLVFALLFKFSFLVLSLDLIFYFFWLFLKMET